MKKSSSQQLTIWDQAKDLELAKLSNALYERQVLTLSQHQTMPLEKIQKRLSSLPFYITKAAHRILSRDFPKQLILDLDNGSWHGPHRRKSPAQSFESETVNSFFQQHAALAMVVPYWISDAGIETIYIDNIDVIEPKKQRIHLNSTGWFNYSGFAIDPNNPSLRLLKPSRDYFIAACCGHRWSNYKKALPRRLTLREMLLASDINWENLKQVKPRDFYRL